MSELTEKQMKREEKRQAKQQRKKKKGKAVAVIIILLILAAILGAAYWFFGGMRSTEVPAEITITVPEGAYASQVADILEENGLVLNSTSFLLYVKSEEAALNIKPGVYTFGPGEVTYKQILHDLMMGSDGVGTVSVTIPEGTSIIEMGDILEKKGICTADEFLAAAGAYDASEFWFVPQGDSYTKLEGYLFPDTYFMKQSWTPDQVIHMLLNQFATVWTQERQDKADAMGLSVIQVLTVASLIEKEAMLDSERATIASVIYNRLGADMLLQIDASVIYALGEKRTRVTFEDLKVDNPYNTYKYKGLPPGPIASPGVKSIDAALNPQTTTYFYYQTTEAGDGSHYFCETYDEHMAFMQKK